MTQHDFNRLSHFIYVNYGIKLAVSKKVMLEGRLQKRLRLLNIPCYKQYCDYVFSDEGQKDEVNHMIDAVTTNKTDFFREADHFNFLAASVLPVFTREGRPESFKVWSAGCSSGEEPYTLAMVLKEHATEASGFDFQILGTDVSNRVLETAVTAVYPEEKVIGIDLSLKKKYLLRSKDPSKSTVRIVPELRSKVVYQRLNLIDADLSIYPMFHAVFCRNVLIYFDRQTQEQVIRKLCTRLETGGYLFLGHSESISNMELPLMQVRPTIFKKM